MGKEVLYRIDCRSHISPSKKGGGRSGLRGVLGVDGSVNGWCVGTLNDLPLHALCLGLVSSREPCTEGCAGGGREGRRWRREGEAQANHLTPGLYDMYACTLTIYALLGQINVFFLFCKSKKLCSI